MSMEELPDEVLAIVLSFLAPRDLLLSVERLSLRFRALLSDEVLWSYLLKSYDGRQLPTATTTHDAAGGRLRGGGKLRAKWEERIRSESGWKALLKAQHMVTKNWREGRFGTRTAKDASSTRCYCMLFDEEQDILLSGNTSGEVQVRRLGTSEMLNSWVAHKRGYLYSMAFVPSPEGNRLATGALDQVVRLWDLNQGQELCHLTGHTGSINALCVMPGDNKLVSCSVDHSTRVWDLEKEECAMVLVPEQQDSVKSVNCVLSWGPQEVMTANNKGELLIFDTTSGLVVATLQTGLRTILSLLRNPQNSNEIFVGGGPLRSESAGFPVLSYDFRMVNGHELVPLKRYLGNSEWVETATFNGLGHLVTGSNDGSINVFDVESGNCISKRWNNGNNSHAVSRLDRRITCMQASPLRLVSGSMDGLIRHWDFAPAF